MLVHRIVLLVSTQTTGASPTPVTPPSNGMGAALAAAIVLLLALLGGGCAGVALLVFGVHRLHGTALAQWERLTLAGVVVAGGSTLGSLFALGGERFDVEVVLSLGAVGLLFAWAAGRLALWVASVVGVADSDP